MVCTEVQMYNHVLTLSFVHKKLVLFIESTKNKLRRARGCFPMCFSRIAFLRGRAKPIWKTDGGTFFEPVMQGEVKWRSHPVFQSA